MINKVILIGNVGQDPETRTLENGSKVGRFSLATSESYKDKDGNWQKSTEWHNVVVWRELAERAQANVKKGSSVFIEGKISYRKYTDKEGNERTVTDIVCSTLRLLDKKESDPQSGVNHGIPAAAHMQHNQAQHAPQQAQYQQQNYQPFPGNDDGLPF
jgi:single-strand DNA-binding protein